MQKNCKECPWNVKSKNNTIFTEHSIRHNKKHNCHMIPSEKIGNVWDCNGKYQCVGNKLFLKNV